MSKPEERTFGNAGLKDALLHQPKLPRGWKLVRLGDECRTSSGGTPSRGNETFFNGQINWIKSGELADNQISESEENLTDEGLKNSSAKIFPAGTILMAMYGANIGKLGRLRIPACTNQAICAIFPDEKIDNSFLFYFLLSSRVSIIQKGFGGAQPNISQNLIQDLFIPLPPLDEQEMIVEILNKKLENAENAIRAAKKQMEDLRSLRAAYLREAFPFDEERLPAGWKWTKFRNIVSDYMSGFACGERDENGVVQLRMNNVNTKGQFIWDQITRVPFTSDKIKKYTLYPGDVLFNNTNSTELVGKSALFTSYVEPVLFSNHFTRLRFNTILVEPAFVTQWLIFKWQTKVFAELCNRWIGQSAIKPNILFELDFPLPPIEDQKIMISKLDKKFEEINTIENRTKEQLKELNLLPQAYLQQAFRGELG